MRKVRASQRWLKCTHTGVTAWFYCETFLPLCFVLPSLYNFPDIMLVVTSPTYLLYMDTAPV